LDYIICAIGIK